MSSDTTQDLSPRDGVHILPTEYPKGFSVARYDVRGRAAERRWFPSLTLAKSYAVDLHAADINRMLADRRPSSA